MTLVLPSQRHPVSRDIELRSLLVGYAAAPLLPSVLVGLVVGKIAIGADHASVLRAQVATVLIGVVGYGYLPSLLLGLPLFLALRRRVSRARMSQLLRLILAGALAFYFTLSIPLALGRWGAIADWPLPVHLVWTLPPVLAWMATMVFEVALGVASTGGDAPSSRPVAAPHGPSVAIAPALTAISVLLAVMCGVAVFAWAQSQDHNAEQRRIIDRYRGVAEEDRVPQDRECQP